MIHQSIIPSPLYHKDSIRVTGAITQELLNRQMTVASNCIRKEDEEEVVGRKLTKKGDNPFFNKKRFIFDHPLSCTFPNQEWG